MTFLAGLGIGLVVGMALGLAIACAMPPLVAWGERIRAQAEKDSQGSGGQGARRDPVIESLAQHEAATAAALTAAGVDVPALVVVAPHHDPIGRAVPVQDLGSTSVVVPVLSGDAAGIPPRQYTREQLAAAIARTASMKSRTN